MDTAELRSSVIEAYERMEAAFTAIDEAGEDADVDDLEALEADFDEARSDHEAATSRLADAEAVAEAHRNLPVAPAEPTETRKADVRVTRESLTYEKRGPNSMLRDLAAAKFGFEEGAIQRLQRHRHEMEVEGQDRKYVGPDGEQRAISSTVGAGGEFIPPVWLQEEWIKLPRAGRAIANTLNKQTWIPGTNTINIPKVTGGAAVAVQTDGGAVQSTDITTGSVTGAVQTVAGQQDVSQQLVDLSVPGIETVIFDDLTRAYDTKIDVACISGAVTNAKGLDQLAGTNAVTFTSGAPTVALAYPKFANAIQLVTTGVFVPPTVIAMHPVRWAWLLAALDSSNRPLIVPSGQPGFNAAGLQERVAAENIVGNLYGLPVVLDPNIPATLGAGTNQDEIFVYRAENVYFYESPPTLRVFQEVLSNTLQVRFQLYGYYAIIAGRLPKSISIVSGTGLTAPTF